MVRVGDKVQRVSEILSQQDAENHSVRRTLPGRVVWVHSRGRFHVVEFELPRGGLVRECFQGVED